MKTRLISRSDIPVDQPLPGSLRDKNGRVLVTAGKSVGLDDLTQLCTRLRDRVYVSEDEWPSDAEEPERSERESTEQSKIDSPDKLIDSIERINRGTESDRQHERKEWATKATLRLNGTHDKRHMNVVTHDISQGGFSFISESYIAAGTPVFATFRVGAEDATFSGIVRSCKIVTAPKHLIGVQFVKKETESYAA